MTSQSINRRTFHALAAGVVGAGLLPSSARAADTQDFKLNYMLPSCMYGYKPLAEILPEAKKIGASTIDVWPKVHGDQREQIDALGADKFAEMLKEHDLTLGCITQYKLGPFGLQDEMRFAQQFGCQLVVTGGEGPKNLTGGELKKAVADFLEKMKPHLDVAEETGVTIAIENHANNLIFEPDSLKWLLELRSSKNLAIALAPYHLPQDEAQLSQLIRDLSEGLVMFYAWQHGNGCHKPMPVAEQLLQMPGRGTLDFQPLVNALTEINYQGWTEVFMHPVPRGIPILPSVKETTEEINRGRNYLDACVAKVNA